MAKIFRLDLGPLGPNSKKKKKFRATSLEIVPNYHLMELNGKLMDQT